MSADFVVFYYGLKFPVREEEIEELKGGKHPHQIAAREFSLDCYWGNFSAVDDEYYVLVGKKIGIIGCEHEWNQEISDFELTEIIAGTKSALNRAGFKEQPKLLMHFEPDL